MKRISKILLLITTLLLITAVIFSISSCNPGEPSEDDIVNITILHTNDTHGHPVAFDEYNNPDVGGLSSRSTLVKQIRGEVENVLLLDAGDVTMGRPESNFFDVIPDFVGMNHIGYDAMCVGNHEFDYGLGVLKDRETEANFPFLSANVYYAGTEERIFTPYIIYEMSTGYQMVNGTKIKNPPIKVAVFGLTYDKTPSISMPQNVTGLEFRSAKSIAEELVPQLRKQADIVVALSHIGYNNDVKLAYAVEGIDVIIGGHSHTLMEEGPEYIYNTYIHHNFQWGFNLGRIDIQVDKRDHSIISVNGEIIDINSKNRVNAESEDFGPDDEYTYYPADGNDLYLDDDACYVDITVPANPSYIDENGGSSGGVCVKGQFTFNFEYTGITLQYDPINARNSGEDPSSPDFEDLMGTLYPDEYSTTVYEYKNPPLAKDTTLMNKLLPYIDEVGTILNEVIGETTQEFKCEEGGIRYQRLNDLPIANLICDAMREKALDGGVDVVFQNGGGIRDALPSGEITKGDIYSVLPFDNTVVTMDMTGHQIMEVLEYTGKIVSTLEPAENQFPDGAFTQVSGLRFTKVNANDLSNLDDNGLNQNGACEEVYLTMGTSTTDDDVRLDGNQDALDEVYTVATNSFMKSGGDDYSMLVNMNDNFYDTSMFQRDLLIAYIQEKGVIDPLNYYDNRIIIDPAPGTIDWENDPFYDID
jgi:2',3'-cyclic-nucleotide 2'-phosphodiesterase (5'-nucleotidase family)